MIELCTPAKKIGLPLRPALLPIVYDLQAQGALSFCEVYLEQLVSPTEALVDCLDTVVNCGVDLRLHSVGILPGVNFEPQIRALHALQTWCAPSILSVHLATGRGEGGYGESFRCPPYTDELRDTLLAHLLRVTEQAGLPIAVENIANYNSICDDPRRELCFLNDLSRAAGASVVFDISNHITTYGPEVDVRGCAEFVGRVPLAYVHISGGRWLNGRYYDTHADPIPNAHFELCRCIMSVTGCDILYERDGGFDRTDEILDEISSLLKLAGGEAVQA